MAGAVATTTDVRVVNAVTPFEVVAMTCVTVEVLVEYEIEELDVVMTTGGSLLVVLPSEEVVDEVSSVEVEVVLSEIGEDDVVATVEVVTKVVLEVLGVVVEGKEVVLEAGGGLVVRAEFKEDCVLVITVANTNEANDVSIAPKMNTHW